MTCMYTCGFPAQEREAFATDWCSQRKYLRTLFHNNICNTFTCSATPPVQQERSDLCNIDPELLSYITSEEFGKLSIHDNTKNAIASVMKYRCVLLQVYLDSVAFTGFRCLDSLNDSDVEQTLRSVGWRPNENFEWDKFEQYSKRRVQSVVSQCWNEVKRSVVLLRERHWMSMRSIPQASVFI